MPPIRSGARAWPPASPFTERKSKVFLAAHGIAVTREVLARDAKAAVKASAEIGYPVVLKIESPDLPHKTEAGGVRVGLADAATVEVAFDEIMAAARRHAPAAQLDGVLVQEMISGGTEMIAGLSRQEPFGMGIVCGAGGVLVELIRDTALDLCPIDRAQAHALLGRTRASRLLEGYRGQAAGDIEAFAQLLERCRNSGCIRRHARSSRSEPHCRADAGSGCDCARRSRHSPQVNK